MALPIYNGTLELTTEAQALALNDARLRSQWLQSLVFSAYQFTSMANTVEGWAAIYSQVPGPTALNVKALFDLYNYSIKIQLDEGIAQQATTISLKYAIKSGAIPLVVTDGVLEPISDELVATAIAQQQSNPLLFAIMSAYNYI